MGKQHGISLWNLIIALAVLGFLAIVGARLLPVYAEYFSVKKIFAAMEQNGETKGTVADIRRAFETRNAIEDVKSVRGTDLEITREGDESVVSAEWAVKVPLVANVSLYIEFNVSTAK